MGLIPSKKEAQMPKINNVEFLTLPQQVNKNKKDIDLLKNSGVQGKQPEPVRFFGDGLWSSKFRKIIIPTGVITGSTPRYTKGSFDILLSEGTYGSIEYSVKLAGTETEFDIYIFLNAGVKYHFEWFDTGSLSLDGSLVGCKITNLDTKEVMVDSTHVYSITIEPELGDQYNIDITNIIMGEKEGE